MHPITDVGDAAKAETSAAVRNQGACNAALMLMFAISMGAVIAIDKVSLPPAFTKGINVGKRFTPVSANQFDPAETLRPSTDTDIVLGTVTHSGTI